MQPFKPAGSWPSVSWLPPRGTPEPAPLICRFLFPLVKRLTGTRAHRATETTSLVAMSNTTKNGITPSNLLPGKNSIVLSGSTWRFLYQDKDGHIAYIYEPKTGTLDDFTVQVEYGGSFQPALGGGAIATVQEGEKTEGIPLRGGKAVNVSKDGDSLIVLWEYNLIN